jgi:hypothetical protein
MIYFYIDYEVASQRPAATWASRLLRKHGPLALSLLVNGTALAGLGALTLRQQGGGDPSGMVATIAPKSFISAPAPEPRRR